MENTAINPLEDHRGSNWQTAGVGLLLLLLIALAGWMIASQVAAGQLQRRQAAAIAAFEEQTGVRILRVVMTAGGGMVDLQYRVLDPDKALAVHDDDNPPTLVDEATGLLIATPFHDHAARELHTAVTYHEIIMNGGGLLQRGSKILLTVGDSKLENLVVE